MRNKNIVRVVLVISLLVSTAYCTSAQEWQWMSTVDSIVSGENNDHPHAFLWIPPNCKQVRGVVVGQHNMIEEGILEHQVFRKALEKLGFAEVWITPCLDVTFDFNKDIGKRFDEMMQSLATVSGYDELTYAPVIPIGHSALASYPWNFAAWKPQRTLAIISVHGDAPLTNLTGSGKPNPDWGNKTIDGIPALFVMGEFEWWENRIMPAFEYVKKHPAAPISLFADAGHGHFDYSDDLVAYLAMFITKAAEYRLPATGSLHQPPGLRFVNPAKGWLMDRWRKDSLPVKQPAPYKTYQGNKQEASWCFDKEMCKLTEQFYAKARGKQNQYIGFMQNGNLIKPFGGHAQYNLKFIPLQDGISFHLKALFTDTSKTKSIKEHSDESPLINRICGPVKKVNDSTFQISFYRMGFNNLKRSNDIWLLASAKGDATYKSAVQQLDLHFPLVNKEGTPQSIDFPVIPDQKEGVAYFNLKATSTSGMPVQYYVQQGPAKVIGNKLVFDKIPPRSKFPVKVTVVAWQYGTSNEPKIQSAESVLQSFYLIKMIP